MALSKFGILLVIVMNLEEIGNFFQGFFQELLLNNPLINENPLKSNLMGSYTQNRYFF